MTPAQSDALLALLFIALVVWAGRTMWRNR